MVAQSQRRDGMTQMAGTPGDTRRHQRPLHRRLLPLVDHDRKRLRPHTGDTSVVDDVFPNVARAVAWFEHHIGADGLLWNVPGWIFIDWAEVDKRGAASIAQRALRRALGHASATGRPTARHRPRRSLAWDRRPRRHRGEPPALGRRARRLRRCAAAGWPRTPRVAAVERRDDHFPASRRASTWDRMLDYVTDAGASSRRAPASMRPPYTAIARRRQVVLAQPFFMHFVHRALAAVNPARTRSSAISATAGCQCWSKAAFRHVLGALARP